MKYGIQYYYSASNNSTGYCKEAHGDNMPSDCVPVTDEMWDQYIAGRDQGLIMQPNSTNNGFIMIHPDTLLTPEELAQRTAQQVKTAANSMLLNTDRFEHEVYKAKMQGNEPNEFDAWRAELLDVALGDNNIMPTTPEFMDKFLQI